MLDLVRVPAVQADHRFRFRPVLQRLRETTGESVHSAVLVGDQVLVVDGRRSVHRMDIGLRVGMTAPAHVMAAGKLLLAAMPDEMVDALLPRELVRTGPASISSRAQLWEELDTLRRRGWAMALQESEPGVNSIAVPLHGTSWRDRVAIVVSIPLARGARQRLEKLAAQTRQVVLDATAAGTIRPWELTRRRGAITG